MGRRSIASVGSPEYGEIHSLGMRESCSAFFAAAISSHGLYGVVRFVLTRSQPEVSTSVTPIVSSQVASDGMVRLSASEEGGSQGLGGDEGNGQNWLVVVLAMYPRVACKTT